METDDLLVYNKEIYTALSQKNRPAQHVWSDTKFIIINSFSFYPVHILTWSSFEIRNVFADIEMVLSV
jgi:hypothetical protein